MATTEAPHGIIERMRGHSRTRQISRSWGVLGPTADFDFALRRQGPQFESAWGHHAQQAARLRLPGLGADRANDRPDVVRVIHIAGVDSDGALIGWRFEMCQVIDQDLVGDVVPATSQAVRE